MSQKIKSFLSKGNRAQWCVFVLFALSIFFKNILFHWECFYSFNVASASHFSFWLNKIIIALFISLFVLISKRLWWTLLCSALIDFWLLANLLYFKANDLFLSLDAIKMANNLKGFENSVTALIDSEVLIFIGISVLLFIIQIFFVYLSQGKRFVKTFVIGVFFIYLLMILSHFPTWYVDYKSTKDTREIREQNKSALLYHNTKRLIIPFYDVIHNAKFSTIGWESEYIKDYSGTHYLFAICIYEAIETYYTQEVTLSQEDIYRVQQYMSTSCLKDAPKHNLIVLFIESFESWTLDMRDKDNNLLLPNLYHWTQENANLLCYNIKSQVRNGVSGDGQLIVNTGLLPLQKGAACLLYSHNVYPNYNQFFSQSAIINPWPNIWGQGIVTYSYGYKQLIEPSKGAQDEWVSRRLIEYSDTCLADNFNLFAITLSSHMPFNKVQNNQFALPLDMPDMMQKYLTCLHYTDSCIGLFLNHAKEHLFLDNSIIVITGDHTVFKEHMLRNFMPYTEKHNLPIKSGKTFVPLIVSSPTLSSRTIVTDTCYQMDIYPTILHLIGCEDYYWKGFGVNLLDSVARRNRPITEQEAYELSDKLIRSNYFAGIER